MKCVCLLALTIMWVKLVLSSEVYATLIINGKCACEMGRENLFVASVLFSSTGRCFMKMSVPKKTIKEKIRKCMSPERETA